MDYFIELGYLGLFIVSFLAATILPIGSELLLVTLATHDHNLYVLLIVATLGNVLGSVVNYAIGFYGGDWLTHKVLKISPQQMHKAEQRYNKWGKWSLLLAWVPIIGDPLTVIAGLLKVSLIWFLVLVTIGKLGRYAVVLLGVNFYV
ncbi:YqaA family protein [Thiomicrorhabdus sp. Kp2]|uniref:YqaA family protein n=1 Tax=Thiomicrorhabdus sp. Kp2 TaxID=1123518 RepID=UPI0003F5D46C|nr:YqaA family protein [Thiomicrorhabdus sp. Kp2]